MLPRVNLVRADAADFLLFSTDDAVSRVIYSQGSWAPPLLTISGMFVNDAEAPFVLDVGANLGAYSVPMAKQIAAAGGTIHCFEPQRVVYYQLCGNIFLNRLDNVFAFNMAVGDEDGRVNIPSIDYSQSRNIGGFTLDEEARRQLSSVAIRADDQGNDVPLIRLDSHVVPKTPSLIKIDVEGLELQVLKGAQNLLETGLYPPLLLEAWNLEWFQSRRQDLLNYLEHLGYKLFVISDEIVAQHPRFPRQIEFRGDRSTGIQMIRTR